MVRAGCRPRMAGRHAGRVVGTNSWHQDRPALPVRIVAMRTSPQAAEKARRKARKSARDHGYTVAQETLEAADYVLIVTTLSEAAADAAEILELYRLRWQIAIAFKRLKSVLHIDEMRAFDPDLAQTYLLAKLLGAVLVDAIRTQGPDFLPTDFPSGRMSPAVWRIAPMIWQDLRVIVQGFVELTDGCLTFRAWTQALHERPRKRRLQFNSGGLI